MSLRIDLAMLAHCPTDVVGPIFHSLRRYRFGTAGDEQRGQRFALSLSFQQRPLAIVQRERRPSDLRISAQTIGVRHEDPEDLASAGTDLAVRTGGRRAASARHLHCCHHHGPASRHRATYRVRIYVYRTLRVGRIEARRTSTRGCWLGTSYRQRVWRGSNHRETCGKLATLPIRSLLVCVANSRQRATRLSNYA
jgi:hypothetical protein